MKDRFRWFGLAVAAMALAAGCGAGGGHQQPPAPGSGVSAPGATVSVPDQLRFTAKTVDGKDLSGSSLAGKPVVLWFWAPWCPVCQREAPTVAKVARENSGKATFVGVAAQDQLPAMKDFVVKYNVDSFAHIADVDASVWLRFGVSQQPAYAFISPKGTVEVVKGALSEQDVNAKISKMASA